MYCPDRKVSQVDGAGKNYNIPLYTETKKCEKILGEKNAKLTKRSHAYKGHASSYNIDNLNSFNPELQLTDTESAIRKNLIDLLSHLRRFKLVTTLVCDDATKFTTL